MNAITTESDLLGLINDRIEERIDLEYKRADSLKQEDNAKREITKDVSSFANSTGGLLIYGVSEKRLNDKPPIPEALDPVDGGKISREWLDQVIGTIRPRLDVLITPIRIGSDSNKVVFIVDIPKGQTAHQASDLRYYKRFNFRAEPMYDHEIRDVIARGEYPSVELQLRLSEETFTTQPIAPFFHDDPRYTRSTTNRYLSVVAVNSGNRLASFITVWFQIDSNYLTNFPGNCSISPASNNRIILGVTNRIKDVIGKSRGLGWDDPIFSEPYYLPLLPSTEATLAKIRINPTSPFPPPTTEPHIEWKLQADSAPRKEGKIDPAKIPIRRI